MTQYRNDPDRQSNYFDDILSGIGHRGSSFSDIDAITHDGATCRFLVQEFKHEGERLSGGQHWMLKDLAKVPDHFTVWVVRRRNDGRIDWADMRNGTLYVLTVEQYQEKFRQWWNHKREAVA